MGIIQTRNRSHDHHLRNMIMLNYHFRNHKKNEVSHIFEGLSVLMRCSGSFMGVSVGGFGTGLTFLVFL